LHDPDRLEELYSCLFNEDAWVRMRAADALEKICRQHSDWLEAFIDPFPNDLATSTQPSIQSHMAQNYREVDLTPAQRRFAVNWLKHVLSSKDVDWIVAAQRDGRLSPQIAKDDSVPVGDIVPLVEIQQNHKSTGWSEQGNGDCVRIRTRTAAQSLSPSSCSAGVV
jgi:hypothetical protein